MQPISYERQNDTLVPLMVTKGNHTTPVWMQQHWQDGEYAPFIRNNGCGHCCTTMAARLRGVTDLTPYTEFELCRALWGAPQERLGRQEQPFLSVSGIVKVLSHLGITANYYGVERPETALAEIISALQEDKLVIFWSHPREGRANAFSTGDHYVLFIGMDNNRVVTLNSSINAVMDIPGIQYADTEQILDAMCLSTPLDFNWGILPEWQLAAGYVIVE